MKETQFLKLQKPDYTDPSDIMVINRNMDKLDGKINEICDALDGAGGSDGSDGMDASWLEEKLDTLEIDLKNHRHTGADGSQALDFEDYYTKDEIDDLLLNEQEDRGIFATVARTGSYDDLTDKPTISDVPTTHASTDTTYGEGTSEKYGHVKLTGKDKTAITENDITVAAGYTYVSAAGEVDLNDYRTVGEWTFYDVTTATNFPAGTWTGAANTSVLTVKRFYSNTKVQQTLYKQDTNEIWVRYSTSDTDWSAWAQPLMNNSTVGTASIAIALGDSVANASGNYSIAFGYNANASGNSAIAVGLATNAIGDMSLSVGYNAPASGMLSATFGYGSKASGHAAVAIGVTSTATGNSALAIGRMANASGDYSTALGYFQVNASGVNSMALGNDAKAAGVSSTAIGYMSNAAGANSMAIGDSARTAAADTNTIQLGATSLSTLRCKVSLTTTSDERDKADIQEIRNGLDFIKKIKPIQYVSNPRLNYIEDKEKLSEKDNENITKYGICEYDREAHANGTKKRQP